MARTATSTLLVLVVLVVSANSRVPAQEAKNLPGETAAAEDAIRSLSREEVEAFLNRRPDVMAKLWSDDLVVTNPLNKFVTKKQVLGMVESGFLVITKYDRQIEYVKVYGDVVILAGAEKVTWGGKMPNAGKEEQLRFTEIWMKQGGRWQEVTRHANIVPRS